MLLLHLCFAELTAQMWHLTVQASVKQHESIPQLFISHNSRPSVLNFGQSTLCNRLG